MVSLILIAHDIPWIAGAALQAAWAACISQLWATLQVFTAAKTSSDNSIAEG